MVKTKLYAVLLTALICILAAPACADHAFVIDDASLYSASDEKQMEEMIREMVDTYQMDIVILTTNDVPYSNGNDSITVDYADTYYENNGYGLGEDLAGVLFIVDMTNRYNYISTSGTMADYLNDRRIEAILSSADGYLAYHAYGKAMITQLTKLEEYLRAGIEEGSFRYDAATGERISGIYNKLTLRELLLAIACGAAAAIAFAAIVTGTYHLRGKTYKYSLGEDNVRFELQKNDEQFLRERVTRIPISTGSGRGGHGGGGYRGGGSGIHISSGGGSHGGGGHHF